MLSISNNDPIDINFETMYKTMISAMKINQIHPSIKKDIKWLCRFGVIYGNAFLIFCLLIYSIIFYDLKNNDITQACANGIICIVFGVLTFENCVAFYYQKDIKEMIEKMNHDFEEAKDFPKDEQILVQLFAQKGKRVIIIWVVIVSCGGSLFVLKSVVLMLYYTLFDEFKFVHIYELTYPDAVEEIKNTLSFFLFINTLFLFYDIYVVAMYIAFTPLGPIFMLHACGQLEIAKKKVLMIFDDSKTDEEIIAQLKDIGRLLREIYSFIDKIKRSFKVLYELTLKTTAIVTPITFYQIFESFKVGEIKIEFLCFIIGGITMSSVPCYYSDKLLESGEQLRLAIYTCGWEKHWEKKSRTLIFLLLLRTTQPLTIRTMFRTLCLDALSDTLHQAYAIFNLLNAT